MSSSSTSGATAASASSEAPGGSSSVRTVTTLRPVFKDHTCPRCSAPHLGLHAARFPRLQPWAAQRSRSCVTPPLFSSSSRAPALSFPPRPQAVLYPVIKEHHKFSRRHDKPGPIFRLLTAAEETRYLNRITQTEVSRVRTARSRRRWWRRRHGCME
jgi:hypothetical protein